MSRAARAGTSDRRGSAMWSSSSRSRDNNCVVHTRRSHWQRSVCTGRPLGSRYVGGRSRSSGAYCVRRLCAPQRHVSMYFFMYRTHIRRGQPRFFTFGTCEGDAECVEALGKRSDDELNFWKGVRPTQGADSAEESPGHGALRVGEQLAQERPNGYVCLYMDILPGPNMRTCPASRAACDAVSRAPRK